MRALDELPHTRVVADSGLFLSKPMVPAAGQITQADYYNAVARIETRLGPHELLDQLQRIEHAQHRTRMAHWGPRTIDLDILMYDDVQLNDERLTLPHAGVQQREFVLYPLRNIDSSLEIPGRGMLSDLIKHCPQNGLQYLGTIEGYKE
jgi:2-amino-4-hydroxy-6-hydroxymethyldihydropteridine diphosphokinase